MAESEPVSGQFGRGNAYRWRTGTSGNPRGRPRGASFSAALARQAVTPIAGKDEMVKIATMIGLDPSQARNIDVVAGLFYTTLSRMLVRAASGSGRVDERVVGMLQVLLKALDPQELRVSGPGGGPIPIAAAVANVQAALGMQPAWPADGERAERQLPSARVPRDRAVRSHRAVSSATLDDGDADE
jgi:hypothetical protein